MRIIAIGILLAIPAFGQTMTELSAAAAAGSVGGVAGKKVSDGIDQIGLKLGEAARAGAQTGEKEKKPAAKPAAAAKPSPSSLFKPADPMPAPEPIPAAAARATKRAARSTGRMAIYPALPPQERKVAAPFQAPDPPALTASEVARIESGASRDDVLAKLGKPAARISIPDGDGFVEIYQYSAHGQALGSLRLVNGVVSSVRPVER